MPEAEHTTLVRHPRWFSAASPALWSFLGAAVLRLAVLARAVPTATVAEERNLDLLDTIPGTLAIPVDPALSEGWVTLLSWLDRVVGEAAITLQTAPSLTPDPDPLIAAGRWLALILSAAAAGLGADAALRLGGRTAAWIAGALLALSPLALTQVAAGSVGALHLCVGAGALSALARARTLPLGLWGGAALAAGGGGAGLLLAVAAAGGLSIGLWIAVVAVGGILAPGLLPGFPMLPPGSSPLGLPVDSPLGSGLLLVSRALGPIALGLAGVGLLRGLIRGPRAARLLIGATFAALLLTLSRFGPDMAALAVALPGFAILAAWSAAWLAERTPRPWGPALAAIMVLALPLTHAVRTVDSYRAPSSVAQATEWIRHHIPNGSALIVEHDRISLPTLAGVAEMTALVEAGTVPEKRLARYADGGRTFQTVPLPPRTPNPLESALFYDPNLAGLFPYLVLGELPEVEIVTERVPIETLTARRLFQNYFRETWEEAATFTSRREDEPDITVLRRPDGWEVDLDALSKLGFVLMRDPLLTLRDESSAFTDWALNAGQALLAGGELPGARRLLGMATDRDSTRVEAHFQFARVLSLLGEADRAKEELLLGMNLDPYHGGIHLQLGALLEAEGDTAGALTEYAAAVLQLPDPTFALARLGSLQYRTGDSAGALSQLGILERDYPNSQATRALREALGASP